MNFHIPNNLSIEKEFIVEEHHTAKFLGNQIIGVLATPYIIGFMEHCSLIMIDEALQKDYTTVGTNINVNHISSAPLGSKIVVCRSLINQNGRDLTFKVSTKWNGSIVGEGKIKRYIVHKERFLKRLKQKLNLDD